MVDVSWPYNISHPTPPAYSKEVFYDTDTCIAGQKYSPAEEQPMIFTHNYTKHVAQNRQLVAIFQRRGKTQLGVSVCTVLHIILFHIN